MKRLTAYIRTMLLVVIIMNLSGCAMIYRQMKDTIRTNYREGISLYRKGKYADALERFEKVESIDPEYADVRRYVSITKEALQKKAKKYYDRGISSKRAGNYDEALDQFLIAQNEDPDYKDTKAQIASIRNNPVIEKRFKAAVTKAEALFNKKNYRAGYEQCLKAQKYRPDNAELIILMKKTESALDDRSAPYVKKAKASYDKGRYEQAKIFALKALEINPWDKDSKSILSACNGRIYLDQQYTSAKKKYQTGDYFGSLDIFNQIARSEPGYRDTQGYIDTITARLSKDIPRFYERGVNLYDSEMFEEAVAEFNKVLKVDQNHQKAKEYRERALAKLELKKSLDNQ
jgi:tetratricopeptide (TPR) repeat protein